MADNTVTPEVGSSLDRLKTAEQKLVGHEKAFQFVDRELNQLKTVLGTVSKGVDSLAELMAAHLDLLGQEFKDKITGRIEENREKARQQKEETARSAVKTRVDNGELVSGDEIDPNSLVVFTEFDKENKEIGVHYTPVWLHELNPEIVPKFLGQKAGFEADVEGGKLRVLEVYRPGTPPAASATQNAQ